MTRLAELLLLVFVAFVAADNDNHGRFLGGRGKRGGGFGGAKRRQCDDVSLLDSLADLHTLLEPFSVVPDAAEPSTMFCTLAVKRGELREFIFSVPESTSTTEPEVPEPEVSETEQSELEDSDDLPRRLGGRGRGRRGAGAKLLFSVTGGEVSSGLLHHNRKESTCFTSESDPALELMLESVETSTDDDDPEAEITFNLVGREGQSIDLKSVCQAKRSVGASGKCDTLSLRCDGYADGDFESEETFSLACAPSIPNDGAAKLEEECPLPGHGAQRRLVLV